MPKAKKAPAPAPPAEAGETAETTHVRIRTSLATAERPYKPGEEVELPSALAEAWVRAGVAEPLEA